MGELSNTEQNPWLQVHQQLGISLMDHLFAKLEGIYPGKWKSSFGSEAAIQNWRIVWASSFDHHKITSQEVKHGLDNLPTLNPDWPPLLGQFITACRHREVVPESHRKVLGLPKYSTPEEREKGLANLAKMKQMLANSRLMKDCKDT